MQGLHLEETRFITLLSNLISVSETLQNNPSEGLIPREDNASDFVLETLRPYSKENGGPLEVERIHYTEGRGNVIIKYPGVTNKTISFIGSHLDVVPAQPENWNFNPFEFKFVDGKMYGRGTTDCLGHIALLTDFLCSIATLRPVLQHSIYVVFIANEENSSTLGVGVDQLAKDGRLDCLKNGPIYWIDSADSQPCTGTAGAVQWRLRANGKVFHSGLPHRGINAIEFLSEALAYIQHRFYQDFPPHPREDEYKFLTSSTMKPTQIECAVGSLNQIPPWATASGDIRITPFYDYRDVKSAIESYVADLNLDPSVLPVRGNYSKYVLPDEKLKARLELTWLGPGENGIACNIDSVGFEAIRRATEEVIGYVKPYAINGSLPVVRWLQDNGFDVQISGYGLSSRYHAENEYAELEDMKRGTRILSRVISILEESNN